MPRQSSTVERIAAARVDVELSSRIANDVQMDMEAMVRGDQELEDEEQDHVGIPSRIDYVSLFAGAGSLDRLNSGHEADRISESEQVLVTPDGLCTTGYKEPIMSDQPTDAAPIRPFFSCQHCQRVFHSYNPSPRYDRA